MEQRRPRAVSHVIAIALLVAIVTILAGTMAVYVGSFGDTATRDSTPNVVWRTSFDDRASPNGQYLNVSSKSGSVLETSNLRLDVDGAERASPSGAVELNEDVIGKQVGDEWQASERLSVNRTVFTDASGSDLTGSEYVDLTDATVRIVYEPGPEESVVLYECEVAMPDCSNREA